MTPKKWALICRFMQITISVLYSLSRPDSTNARLIILLDEELRAEIKQIT